MILGFTIADIKVMSDDEYRNFGLPTWKKVLRNLGDHSQGKDKWQHCGLMTPTSEFYPEM